MIEINPGNIPIVIKNYLSAIGLKTLTSKFLMALEENPFYPNIFSLTQTARQIGLTSNAYEVEKEQLVNLNVPYVALVLMPNEFGKGLILVTKSENNQITFTANTSKKKTISQKEFKSAFQGVVWLISGDNFVLTAETARAYSKERNKNIFNLLINGLLCFIFSFVLILSISGNNFTELISIAILKTIGLTMSVSLISFLLNSNSSIIKKICSASSNSDCKSIINKNSSFFLGVSWSELSFLYFISTLLLLFLPTLSNADKVSFLSFFSLSISPIILFSVYIQFKVIKKWCKVCLLIDLILLAELLWSIQFWQHPYFPSLSLNSLISILLLFLAIILIWYNLKSEIYKASKAKKYITAYKRLKNNPEIFRQQLLAQERAEPGWENIGIPLNILSQEFPTLLKVCNLFCGPCGQAFSEIDQIIQLKLKVNIRVIFVGLKSKSDISIQIVRHFLSISSEGDKLRTQEAMTAWYNNGITDIISFLQQYPPKTTSDKFDREIESMILWANKSNIKFTPTYFFDGYKLPNTYSLSDLKNILK